MAEGLLRAAMAVLRPLVRHLLSARVPFGRFEKRARALFVRVAEEDFPLPDRPQTDSRISSLTGINRKEIHRIRAGDGGDAAPRSFSRDLASNLVSVWMQDPAATDRSGRPIPIPYRGTRGPSFVKLARQTTLDLRPRAILDSLIGSGAAEVGADGLVALRTDSYVPTRGQAEKLGMLAEDPAELIQTMLRNIVLDDIDPHFQRKVAYDNLGADGMERLRAALRREGERFARRVNTLLARNDRDRNAKAPGGARTSAGIGVYYFESPHPIDAKRRTPTKRKRRTS